MRLPAKVLLTLVLVTISASCLLLVQGWDVPPDIGFIFSLGLGSFLVGVGIYAMLKESAVGGILLVSFGIFLLVWTIGLGY